jgi:diadenosine tetraphosphate (Ap4A) HIT family hydrolase
MAECRLCELAAGRARGMRLYEDEHVVVLLGLRDGLPSRLLVVPRRHCETEGGLDEALRAHLIGTGERAARSLGDAGMDLGAVHAELQRSGQHVYLQVSPTPACAKAS